jgi:hypothetical protein
MTLGMQLRRWPNLYFLTLLNGGGKMLGRVSPVAVLFFLLTSGLGAQANGPTPRLRGPRLVADSALLALLPSARFALGPDLPQPVTLRFDPFTHDARQGAVSARPSMPEHAELPRCPMPVQRTDSTRDRMPVATPDSTKEYFIRVAPPGCVAKDAR